MSPEQADLTSGVRLTRNVFWNLLGIGAPLLVALVAVPMIIEGLGTLRFGLLTLAWMAVGYFNLFDMGLGRALTKLVAEKLGKEKYNEVPSLIWTAMILMGGLGLLSSLVLFLLSPMLVRSVLKIPLELQVEALIVFYILAAAMPFVITTTGLRGVLEAHQRFGLINAVRIPLGIFTFLGPLATLYFSKSLVAIVAVLVIARLVSWLVYVGLCVCVEPNLRYSFGINRKLLESLIKYGGWVTVVNLIKPIMVYMDRFFIGAIVSIAAVAYYTVPYEIATKLWIVPGALMGVMFPAFSALYVQDRIRVVQLCDRAVKYTFLSLFPIVLILVTFAREGLTFWLSSEFADNSSLVLQLLIVGVFINSHARVPSGVLQGAGRPDITAMLHLVELPFYLLMLWLMLNAYGIIGAAIAWILRVVIDTVLLFFIVRRLLPTVSSLSLSSLFTMGVALFLVVLGAIIPGPILKGLFLLLVLGFFTIIVWFFTLTVEERNMVGSYLKNIVMFSPLS